MNMHVEEMAQIIHKGELDRNRGDLDCTEFPTNLVIKVGLQRLAGAKALYNAGYRKQSDTAREIFEEIEEVFFKYADEFSSVGECKLLEPVRQAVLFSINELFVYVDELKKKYTESEKDNVK